MISLQITTVRRFPAIISRSSMTSYQCSRYGSTSEEVLHVNSNDPLPAHTEEEVEMICNKSKLRTDHHRIYNGLHPQIPDDQKPQYMRTLKWQRKLIGMCGFEGQYDPAICFTTKEEMEDLTEYENVAFNVPLLEIRNRELQKLDNMKKERYEREKKITQALAKQEEWKTRILAKRVELNEAAEQAKAERARILEEVRRYFGYTIDPKDEKFQIMLAVKEREVAKEKKQEKKKQKEEHFLAKLAALEIGSATPNMKSEGKTNDAKETEKDS